MLRCVKFICPPSLSAIHARAEGNHSWYQPSAIYELKILPNMFINKCSLHRGAWKILFPRTHPRIASIDLNF